MKRVVHSIWEGGNTIRDIIVNAMVKRVVLENVYIVLLEGRTYILTSTCAVSYMCREGNIYRECNRLCLEMSAPAFPSAVVRSTRRVPRR